MTSAGLVPWKRDLLLPARFGADIDDDELPYVVELEVRVVDGRPTCSRLTLLQRDGGAPVTSRELRGVQLSRYLALAAGAHAMRFTTEGMAAGSVAVEPMWGEEVVVRRTDVEKPSPGRRPLTDDHLKKVAQIYREAQRDGRPTSAAISAELSGATATVSRWVGEARARGFLEKAVPRWPAVAPKKQAPKKGRKS
jgi:hypothetical protein